MVNSGATADRLVSVSTPAATSVRIQGDTAMPQDVALVSKGNTPITATGTREIQLVAEGLTQPVAAGRTVPMTFVFERAGSVTVDVPTAIPAEGRPGAEPERVAAEGGGHGGGHGSGETGVGGHGGGESHSTPAPGQEHGQPPHGGAPAPGNEGTGSGGGH
nr:copper chaperone PCu(A)C [Pseudonocardia sp. C8]